MKIRRLSIIGLGLIGSSIALAVRRNVTDAKITGYDVSRRVGQIAVRRGIVRQAVSRQVDVVQDCDLVILAAPAEPTPGILREIGKDLPERVIVTDACSTKRSIVAAAAKWLPNRGRRFVGGHPMFGSERSGIEHADAALLAGSPVILTPMPKTEPSAVRTVIGFWRSLGLSPSILSPAEHDRRMARVSHLPQAVASVLMSLQDASWLSLAGRGLLDTTRLAGSDPKLWAGILIDNADHSASEIRRMARSLHLLADAIQNRDSRVVARMFDAGRKKRAVLLRSR